MIENVRGESGMRDAKKRQVNSFEIILGIFLLMVITYTGYLIIVKLSPYALNSDLVNEISYRQSCWEQKSLFPRGFVGSSESMATRPVLIYWIFYGITHNFLLSYQLEAISTFICLLCALYYLMKKLNICRVLRFLGLCMFVVCLSDKTKTVSFWNMNSYVGFIISVLCTLAIRISLRDLFSESKETRWWMIGIYLIILFLLSFALGYGTIRMALILYCPLLIFDCVGLIKNYFKGQRQNLTEIRLSILTAALLLVNVLTYVISCHVYPDSLVKPEFWIADVGRWLSWDILSSHLQCIVTIFGIKGTGSLKSIQGLLFILSSLVALIEIISIIWLMRKKKEADRAFEVIWYWLLVTVIIAGFLIVTGSLAVERYYCMTGILLPVLCMCTINDWVKMKRGGYCLHSSFINNTRIVHNKC